MRLVPSMIRNTLLRGKRGVERDEAAKRATSLVAVIRYAVTGLVVLLAGVTVMSELGLNTGPLLASIGIVGIAVGFGSQHLVRDIIAGTFRLAEDQYRVGDAASVGGKTGLVEAVNLRRAVLRDLDGIVHIVPNGEITIASNYTKTFSRVNLNVFVAYKEDMDHVIRVLNRVGHEMAEDVYFGPLIMEPPRVIGVDSFDDSGIAIKVLGVTKPIRQWDVTRELRRRIKRAFDEEGIEIPFPQRTLHWGSGANPAEAQAPPTAPRRRARRLAAR